MSLLTATINKKFRRTEKMDPYPSLTLVMPNEDGSLSSTVYRKPTHTDQYLHWDSHHTLPSKYSVIGTLYHRAKTICSNPRLLKQEEDHLYRALPKCIYPAWALNRIKIESRSQNQKKEQ